MPLVEVPDVGEVEFPDSMSQEEIVAAIEKDILPARTPVRQRAPDPGSAWRGMGGGVSAMDVQDRPLPVIPSPQPSLGVSVPEPGSVSTGSTPALNSGLPQAFPAMEQRAESNRGLPGLTADEAEEMLMTPQVSIPNPVPKEYPKTRALMTAIKGIPEAATMPGFPALMAAQLVPGLNVALDATLSAAALKSGAIKAGEASVTGDQEKMTEALLEAGGGALGLGAVTSIPQVLPALAREVAARRVGRPDLAAVDTAVRQNLRPQPLLPETAKAIGKETPSAKPLKETRPPETPRTEETPAPAETARPSEPPTEPVAETGTVRDVIPQSVLDAQIEWRAAEKRYRRARRQEPTDVEEADIARMEAEGLFRAEAEKAQISQEQFDRLRQDAKLTETEATADFEQEINKETPITPESPAPIAPPTGAAVSEATATGVPPPEAPLARTEVTPTAVPEQPKPRKPVRPLVRERPPDIIDFIKENVGKLRGKKSARPGEEGYYPDSYRQAIKYGAVRDLFSNAEGQSLDSAVDILRREGFVGRDFSVDDLHDALTKAALARQEFRKSGNKEKNVIAREESMRKDFEKEAFDEPKGPDKGAVIADELLAGDTFELAGEQFRVKELVFDPETADLAYIVVEDGRRFGVQTVSGSQVLYPDAGTLKQNAPSTEFLPDPRPREDVNRELNALKAKTNLTEPEKQRVRLLEEELGQMDLLDVKPTKEAEVIQRDKDAAEQRAKIAELQAQRLRGEAGRQTGMFDEDKDIFGAQGAPPAMPGGRLTPTPATVPTKTPKSQRQIITDLAKGLKVPIRFGRLRFPKFGGYFLPRQHLVASKFANDLPVVTHEVGHRLDKEWGFRSDKSVAAELDKLGDPSTPGSMSSWTKSKSKTYKMGEGVAEFVRYWLTDPAKAQADAPNMFAKFEQVLAANKDFADVLTTAQNDIQTWRSSEAQARLRSHISVGENPNKTPYTLSQLTRDLVDDLHILRLATDDAARGMQGPIRPTSDIYKLGRLLRGSYGMAESFVRRGVVDWESRSVTLGTSLEDALKPVGGRLNDFRDWIVAKRAQELRGQGKETGLVASDVDTVVNRFDADADFQAAFEKVKEWEDSVLQYTVDAGLLTKESADAMREMNLDYVPFHRVFEVGAGEMPSVESGGTGRGLNTGKPSSLRGLKGSARDIVDPLETMVKNAYALITAAEKAHIHRALAQYADMPGMGKWVERIGTPKDRINVGLEKIRDQLEKAGADLSAVPDDLLLGFFQTSRQAPFGENTIRIVRDGNPEFYRLDRDLFDTFHALDLEDAGQLIRILASPAQLLRSGVVLAPDFALANVLRDTFSAAVISKYNAFPFEVTLRGVAAMMRDPKLVAEWAAAGGKNSVEAAYFDRKKMQQLMKERISKDLTAAERATIVLKSPMTALRWLTEKAEEATRIGEYQKAYQALRRQGMPEGDARRQAAFDSRDRQDFAKGGAKTKILRRLTPFWNAALQGNVRLVQAFKDRPVQTALKGLAFVTLPKMLEQAVNWDDEDYWDRPQWERDLFFLIPFAKDENNRTRFLRIPTPFEVGVIFGTFPGRVVQWARGQDRQAADNFMKVFLRQTVPNPMPPFANAVFENLLSGRQGWDIYRGRNIVPDSLADMPPELQWTEQTSLTARKIGKLVGYSPLKIDHLIRSTTGGVGQQLVHNVSDRAISAATAEPVTAQGKRPGGRFVTTPAGVQSEAVNQFYENLRFIRGEAQRAKLTGTAREFASLATEFNRAADNISDLRRRVRATSDQTERQRLLLLIAERAKAANARAREAGVR